MFGIIYIVLSLLAGKELAEILLFTGKNAQEAGSRNGQHKAFCNQIWVLAQLLLEWEHWYLDGQRT